MSGEFTSFQPGARAAVIGSGGGLGAAFVDQLSRSPVFETVYAISRNGHGPDGATALRGDVTDLQSLEQAAQTIEAAGALDLVIVATGVLHGADGLAPEKSFRALDPETMRRVFEINTFGPAFAAKVFLPKLAKDRRSVFAALSARVGSISDNGIGGWHSYRASKAALNMMIRNFAIEMSRRNASATILALHPGTVDTRLSKPFQSGAKTLFTPEQSVAYMLKVIDAAEAEDSGKLFAWDGAEIPF